jgi:hypothetical protein
MSLAEGYSVSRYTTLGQPVLSAYLWNPPTDRIEVRYPYKDNIDIERLEPALVLAGHGFRDGDGALHYALRANERIFEQGELRVGVRHGWFEVRITPSSPFPEATSVDWSLGSDQDVTHSGTAQLRWSRFQGVVRYRDGNWRSSHIDMRPVGWGGTPTNFTVPVMDNGSFDVLVPARVYGIVNVNGSGYGYDALERWAWDYDLTVDRNDEFIIGRTELYGMRAFDTKGGPSTLFVIFRPTALSSIPLRYFA